MKKFIYILITLLSLFFIIGCKKDEIYLISKDEYKDLIKENIKSVSKISLTESGREEINYNEKEEIYQIYNYISNIKITTETKMAFDDNTNIYIFNMNNNKKITIEIECDWVLINNKRYLISK